MNDTKQRVKQLLRLSPLVDQPIPFEDFLLELLDHPERADSAPAVVFRAVMAMGVEDPDKEPDPDRRLYLKMLQEMNVPSLMAFKHTAGTQRFAMQPMAFLKSAGSNGNQLRQMLIIEGGPGSGKDYFKDGIVAAIERYTDENRVYAVKGCPHRENPVSLLKLLQREQLDQLLEAMELTTDEQRTRVYKLLDATCDPCSHCYQQVMGTVTEPKDQPSLDTIEVIPMRLSARSAGLSEWKPGQASSLAAAMEQGNRGFISMPDAFIERKPREGETDERLLLLDATQYRRLPGKQQGDGVTAASPLDIFIIVTTNKKAMDSFLEGVVPDKDAFTSRAVTIKLPYNLVRCEEVRAYRLERDRFKNRAEFDPMVEKIIATLAVLSRFSPPNKSLPFVHPIDKMRLLQGERITVKARSSSDYSRIWEATSSSSSSGGYGGGWNSGYGSGSSRSGSDSSSESAGATTLKLPTDIPLSIEMVWASADPLEGQQGLDMRTMMSLLSSINEFGLMKPKDKCVTTLEVLGILRSWMARKAKATNITPEQKTVFERCLKWLGGEPRPNALEAPPDTPEIIEGEYRRMLRDVIIRVFAPDYEERAAKLFVDYRLHATGAVENKPTVKDPQMGNIPVNHALIDELDRYRLDKPAGSTLYDDDKKFRATLDAIIGQLRDEFVEQFGADKVKDFKVTWETIPEIRKAIAAKLDGEIGKFIEKLITTEVKSDLTSTEQEQLERAEKALIEQGFSPACQKQILEYAKKTRVWAFKATN